MPRYIFALSVLLPVSSTFADIDFAHDVVPILRQHCAECHSGEESEGGFSFNTQRLLLESEAVVPGAPQQSRLIELIQSADSDDQMPPADRKRLSEDQIGVLNAWILEGARWEPGFRFGHAGYEPPLKPRQVNIPPADHPGQHPIDRILVAQDAAIGPVLSNTVDDAVFLKRVYMDLIGILPTLEEQQDFLQSDESNRRETLIDSLLSRNHDYADHWMAFWNDLLRNDYKGTGYIDGGRKQISSWLYRSLVENKGYDQMVRELVAPSEESAGFIRGIKWRGDVNASQVREIQFAQNVGQVFLGINMKCASCHDSFIDRWTLDESYGLAAIYSERDLEIHRCDKPTGRIAQARWIFPELGQVDATAEQPERLHQLADLITSPQNGRLSRTIVNRLWHRLMGHGIVHPVDAMHTEPWNADLLDYLANKLVAGNYNLRNILKIIASSQAYQAVAAPAQDSAVSDEFVFHGPIARHLTAEQFMDAVWRLTGTSPAKADAPIPMDVYLELPESTQTNPGRWVWGHASSGSSAAGESFTFSYNLKLAEPVASAECIITCDNEYRLQVNGRVIRKDSNFAEPDIVSIGQHLKAGQNEIIVRGRNAGSSPNPAGLYVDILLRHTDDSVERIPSGTHWTVQMEPNDDDASPEGFASIPVPNQQFLGPEVNARLATAVQQAINGRTRPVRASMVISNLLMRSLGRPNREQVVTTRPPSVSTLQAIDLANGEILNDLMAKGAASLLPGITSADSFTESVFRQALCRSPSKQEQQLALALLGDKPDAGSVQDLLWTVIMLPEFQFVQ